MRRGSGLCMLRPPGPLLKRPPVLGTVRRAKVHTRSCPLRQGYTSYPLVRLSGHWLAEAGFSRGHEFEVKVSKGKLVLRAV